ncbi:MAG: SDR family oxidoreductase [Halanaeroarchaeum sp.]
MILVTGATGTVGGHVVSALKERGAAIRVGRRSPEDASDDEDESTSAERPESRTPVGVSRRNVDDLEVVAFDYEKPETWGSALTGVEAVFVLRPAGIDADTIERFVAAAGRSGVSRVVYLSGIGADWNPLNSHFYSERRVADADVAHTVLRASYFMQNLRDIHRRDVAERGEVFVPAGGGAVSFVDARDIGAVAATALTESGHENRAYDVTGPSALDFEAVAAVFTDVLDREITYPNPSLLSFARRLRGRGASLGDVAFLGSIYTAARLGMADRVSEDVERVLERRPRSLRDFVADNADAFRPES